MWSELFCKDALRVWPFWSTGGIFPSLVAYEGAVEIEECEENDSVDAGGEVGRGINFASSMDVDKGGGGEAGRCTTPS